MTIEKFETAIIDDIKKYLYDAGEIDIQFPECPDVEEKWIAIGQSYINDGIREFNNYPTVSLGWMFYIGMALAQYWDTDWEIYSKVEDIYTYMRDKRDYDHLDDYIAEDILQLDDDGKKKLRDLSGEVASRVYNSLCRAQFEPGTKDAFQAYVSSLHLLYLSGMAVQLHRLGYHMTKMN